MKSIKEQLKVPSAALQAMVDGLRKQSKRKDFVINMSTYGESRGEICFGCAATCAVQQISGINLTVEDIDVANQSLKLGYDFDHLSAFEMSINAARLGDMYLLFLFFDLVWQYDFDYDERFFLKTENWEEQLPAVEALIAELKEKGL